MEKQIFSSCEKNLSKKFKFLNADGAIAVQAADCRCGNLESQMQKCTTNFRIIYIMRLGYSTK